MWVLIFNGLCNLTPHPCPLSSLRGEGAALVYGRVFPMSHGDSLNHVQEFNARIMGIIVRRFGGFLKTKKARREASP
jgi:hypothetical protein